jgi:hypothetical protein
MRHLVEAELPHHHMDRVLLDVDVEHQMSRHLPIVVLVSKTQRREALWCAAGNASL